MKRNTFASVCLLLISSPFNSFTADPQSDVLLRAMSDELARSKALQLNDLDKPYFLCYTMDDPDEISINASLGGLISSVRVHQRESHVQVRVGDSSFDNTDSLFSTEPRPVPLSIDDNYGALRSSLWIATDGGYKAATEQINRKRTALREIADPDKIPDLAPAKAVQILEPSPKLTVGSKHWEQVMQRVSGRFAAHPAITFSGLRMRAISSTFRLANSEGTLVRIPEEVADIGIRARAIAPDGSYVWNHRFFTVFHAADLPDETNLAKSVDALAVETESLVQAPIAEEYSGPVLFEQEAAAQMIAEVLDDAVRLERKPLTPPEFASRAPRILESVWASRINSRVLPEWLSIVDNPLETKYKGTILTGQYDVDEEGVPAQAVNIVDKGILKAFLVTRQPVRTFNASNGHGRLPGNFGAEASVFGNLFVNASQTVPESQMKAKLLEKVKLVGLKYGMLIRRLDFPSTASVEELQNMGAQLDKTGTSRTLTVPILAYRVYPDGREELVRGVRFKDFSAKDLRDLEAASDRSYVLNYVNNGTSFNHVDTPSGATTSSVVCPSLLLDSVDLDRANDELTKPPVAPPPALVAQQ